MNKETANYIWHCMAKDSVYNYGISHWCDDRNICISALDEFFQMVEQAIEKLESNVVNI